MNRLLKRALSHPDRKEILGYLMGSGEPTSERELADVFSLGEPKVRYHLKVLRDAKLVTQIDEGQGQDGRTYAAAGMASR